MGRSIGGWTLLLVCMACGPSTSSGGPVNGNIRGRSFQPLDAISDNVVLASSGSTFNVGLIALSSSSGMCGKLTAGQQTKDAQHLLLAVLDFNSSTGQTSAPSGPGTYSVSSGTGQPSAKLAVVSYVQTDGACNTSLAATGNSGTVTLTSVSNGSYSGMLDIGFDSGDHLTGSFTASNCAGLSQLGQSGPTCI